MIIRRLDLFINFKYNLRAAQKQNYACLSSATETEQFEHSATNLEQGGQKFLETVCFPFS